MFEKFTDKYLNEAKVTAKTIDKLTNQIAKLTKELKDNFALYKKAKTDEDKKKHLTIAGEKTREKHHLDAELEKAIQNFGADMELDMTFENKDLIDSIEYAMNEARRGHSSTQFFDGVRANDGDLFHSKRHGLAVKKGDKLYLFYAWEGEPKLGKVYKTDKLHKHIGPATPELVKTYYGDAEKAMADYANKLEESINEAAPRFLKKMKDSEYVKIDHMGKKDVDALNLIFDDPKMISDFKQHQRGRKSRDVSKLAKLAKPFGLEIYVHNDFEEKDGDITSVVNGIDVIGNKANIERFRKEVLEESVNESLKGKLKALYKAAQKKFGKTKVVPPNDADYETAEKYIEMEYGKGHSLFAIGVDKIQDVINIQVGDDKTRETEDIVIDRPAENANESVIENEDAIKPGKKIKYKQLMGMGAKQDWVELTGVVQKVKKKRKDPFGNVNPHKEFHLRSGSIVSPFKNHKDIELNEEREFGMFNGDMGKPTKLDKEVLDIALKALPSKITKNIAEVEGSGAYKRSQISPPTVSNKGQSRGEIEYTTIYIMLDKPMGRNKVQGITVGLRKRTSGPGTGYLYMSVSPDSMHSFGPDAEGAIEFWDDPSYFLKKLYNEKFKNWF